MEVSETTLNIRVSADNLSVLLDCDLPEDSLKPLVERVKHKLAELEIENIPGDDALEKAIFKAGKKENWKVRNLVLVEGRKAVPSEDGRIEWEQDFFSTGFAINEETGKMDYRRRVAKLSVVKGMLLARITHPREGEPGRDVFGQSIGVNKPKKANIKTGRNIRIDEKDGADYFFASLPAAHRMRPSSSAKK